MEVNCTWNESCKQTRIHSNTSISDSNLKSQLISDELKSQLEIYIHVITFTVTSLLGITTNIINIIVYWKQGLKDSITVGFFALSMSDLTIVTMHLFTASCYAAKIMLPDSNIDFPSIHYVTSGTLRKMGYSLSCVFTAFLSLERCYCVVSPFKVKMIFTRNRTATILVTIFAFHAVCYVPLFASQGLRWTPVQYGNDTIVYHLRIYFTKYRNDVEQLNYILMGIVIPTTSQIVVTVCVVVLINGLRASSRFRRTVTQPIVADYSPTLKKPAWNISNSPNQTGSDSYGNGLKSKGDTSDSLTSRDARLVKTMVFIVIILSASNVPLLMITYAQRLIPDLDIGGVYQNTYSLCSSIVYVLSGLNASANIFVYYKTSTKYREVFRSVMGCKQ